VRTHTSCHSHSHCSQLVTECSLLSVEIEDLRMSSSDTSSNACCHLHVHGASPVSSKGMFRPQMLTSKSSCRPKQPSPLSSQPNQSSKTLLKPMPLVHAATGNPRPSCLSRAASHSAASTSTSLHIRRRGGPQMRLQPLRDDEVYYLAYGSNMSPQVLSGRRRVRPHRSVPCYCPGKALPMPLMPTLAASHALNLLNRFCQL